MSHIHMCIHVTYVYSCHICVFMSRIHMCIHAKYVYSCHICVFMSHMCIYVTYVYSCHVWVFMSRIPMCIQYSCHVCVFTSHISVRHIYTFSNSCHPCLFMAHMCIYFTQVYLCHIYISIHVTYTHVYSLIELPVTVTSPFYSPDGTFYRRLLVSGTSNKSILVLFS